MRRKFLYKVNNFSTTGFYISRFKDEVEVGHLLQMQKSKMLPVDTSAYQQIVVHRKHLWEDALNCFKGGLDFTKYICISFVGEPAVDEGGPLREFLHLLIGSIATNNSVKMIVKCLRQTWLN